MSSDVEHIIERGPGEGGTDLQSYINALERLSEAQKYFEKNIPQSVELINVVRFHLKKNDIISYYNIQYSSLKNSLSLLELQKFFILLCLIFFVGKQ